MLCLAQNVKKDTSCRFYERVAKVKEVTVGTPNLTITKSTINVQTLTATINVTTARLPLTLFMLRILD